MEEFYIAKYYPGKFGYKSYFELKRYNSVYERYYVEHGAIELQFIYDYCLLHGIKDYKDFPIREVSKS